MNIKSILFLVALILLSPYATADNISAVTSPGQYLFNWVDSVVIKELSSGVTNLVKIISPVIGGGFLLWSVIYAWTMIVHERKITDLLWQFFASNSILYFAVSIPFYVTVVFPTVNAIPDAISSAFLGSGQSISSSTDSMLKSNMSIISDMWAQASIIKFMSIDIYNLKNLINASIVISIMGNIYIAIGLFLIVCAKILVNVGLALGPIYIAAALFPATRHYFNSWLNQIFNYVVLMITITVLFTLQLSLVKDIVKLSPDGKLYESQVGFAFIIYLVCICLLAAVPVFAASVSGGSSMGGMINNLAGTVSTMTKSLKSGAGLAKSLKSSGNKGSGGKARNLGVNTVSGGKPPRLG